MRSWVSPSTRDEVVAFVRHYSTFAGLFDIKMTYMIEDEEGARNAEYFVNYGDIMFGLGDLERILKGDIYRMHALIKNVVETAAKYKKDNISRKITLAGGPANNEEFLPFFLYLLSLHQNIYLCQLILVATRQFSANQKKENIVDMVFY